MPKTGLRVVSLLLLGTILSQLVPLRARAEEALPTTNRVMWVVAPLAGWDENKLFARGPGGARMTLTDTGPEYGMFLMMVHPNLVVNNFIFWADVNDADVFGDLLFANYFVNSEKVLTWNFGAGYLYHKIKPENEDIRVNTPMVKTGPRFKIPALHMSLNPYLGYAWERIDTQHGDLDNNSILYGLTANLHWRMIEGAVNYYYQDSQDIEEDFQVLRGRLSVFVNRTWGISTRVDYMQHQTTDDLSFLIGPVFVF